MKFDNKIGSTFCADEEYTRCSSYQISRSEIEEGIIDTTNMEKQIEFYRIIKLIIQISSPYSLKNFLNLSTNCTDTTEIYRSCWDIP